MRFLFLLLFSFFTLFCFGQASDTSLAPYKRHPTIPAIQLLLGDSTTKYAKASIPKKKPVLLMIFSPECGHCQHTAEEMVQYKNEIKDIQIIMTTLHPLWMMNEFVEKYKPKQLQNVVVGKDIYYITPSFYNIKSLPYLAFYDKKGDLIRALEGSLPIPKVVEFFNQKK